MASAALAVGNLDCCMCVFLAGARLLGFLRSCASVPQCLGAVRRRPIFGGAKCSSHHFWATTRVNPQCLGSAANSRKLVQGYPHSPKWLRKYLAIISCQLPSSRKPETRCLHDPNSLRNQMHLIGPDLPMGGRATNSGQHDVC